ncbi:MAG: hypothetical protein Ct9H300mP31_19140 [Acidimicrobiaceae bacterium]|nr:MAG: hypothetical protein Ct9H300mP31_19140 [Acidimicrobiaceae bacterium]
MPEGPTFSGLGTMSALSEVEAGVRGARQVSDLPIVVTLSYDTAGCTMMGVTGQEAGVFLLSSGWPASAPTVVRT